MNPSPPVSIPPPNNPRKEIEALKKSLQRDERNFDAYLRLSSIYIEQKKLKKAKAILQDLLKLTPNNGQAFFELGKIYRKENNQTTQSSFSKRP
ncbi:tetratricopeptide repeat protein [Acidobacteriota bacterium]